jgi:hypothetical protein
MKKSTILRDLVANGEVIRERMRRPGDGLVETIVERSSPDGMLWWLQHAVAQEVRSMLRKVCGYMNWSRDLLNREAVMGRMCRQADAGGG